MLRGNDGERALRVQDLAGHAVPSRAADPRVERQDASGGRRRSGAAKAGGVSRAQVGAGATVDVVAVPAQHFSGRGALDRNATLWAGMCLLGPRHRVFFSGDTGATIEHADIGASFGPFDIALFEIGAFHPAWGDIHLGPDGAFDAFARINARALLPVHWSTFDLGLHPWQEPAERLYTRTRREHAALLTPRLGEPLERDSLTTPWWREVVARRS